MRATSSSPSSALGGWRLGHGRHQRDAEALQRAAADLLVGGQQRHALHQVAQLAHVPRPGVRQQPGSRAGVEPPRRQPVRGRVLAKEVLGERHHVGAAPAQRRHVENHDGQTMVQIRPEPSARHQLAQVPLRGCDQLDVEPQRGHRAETPDALLLDHLEQLALERHRERVDLVEEEGAARRRLEEPGLGAPRIGEGPGLEAEQLGFEHGLWNRRAVDVDEGSPCPAAAGMDHAARPAPCRSRSRPARARWARADCRECRRRRDGESAVVARRPLPRSR